LLHSIYFEQGMISGMDRSDEIRGQIEEMKSEHRDLDLAIARIGEEPPFDQLHVQRLKKRKLVLKDQISQLENQLLPDLIA
jgi:hypothetical protein